VINVIRDPRDGYLSSKSNDAISQKTAKACGRYWKKSIEIRQRFIDSPAVIDIKYENLTNNPEKEFTKLMAWLGLEYEKSQISETVFIKLS